MTTAFYFYNLSLSSGSDHSNNTYYIIGKLFAMAEKRVGIDGLMLTHHRFFNML